LIPITLNKKIGKYKNNNSPLKIVRFCPLSGLLPIADGNGKMLINQPIIELTIRGESL
jgi:hypothetical protein